MRHRLELEDTLNSCAVIRTTFETRDLFAADDPIREEMFNIIADSKISLQRVLFDLTDAILTRPETLDFNFEAFQTNTLEWMQSGYPKRGLNRMMKTDAFSHEENGLYYFPLAGMRGLQELKALSAPQFMALLLCELADSANAKTSYKSKHTFDQNVFEKCIGFLFLYYASRDPLFYKMKLG